MAINEGLLTLFAAQSSITDLLTNGTSGIYLDYAPQTDPGAFIEIHVLRDDSMPHLTATSGMRETEIDIDCKARTRPAATDIADAVESYVADLQEASAGSDTLNAVVANPRAHDYEPPDGKRTFGRAVETVNLTCFWT